MPFLSGGSGGGGGAVSQLAQQTLSGAGIIDIQNIPGTATSLWVVGMIRGTRAAASTDGLNITVNNDSGSNYDAEVWYDNGSAWTLVNGGYGVTAFQSLGVTASTATANRFTMVELLIPGYASTSWHKMMFGRVGFDSAAAVTSMFTGMHACGWNSTAAITRITMQGANTANLVSGSQVTVYGIT
jgi:hypothetical protein